MTLQNHPLQYGNEYYPELEYAGDFKTTILNDLVNFRYTKNDDNSGVQLQIANFNSLYPIIYFDLTGDPKTLALYYRLNEAADDQDYLWGIRVL